MADRADGAIAGAGADRVRSVLDQRQPVRVGERPQGDRLARVPGVGNGDDGARARPGRRLSGGGRQPRLVQAGQLGEHRHRAALDDRGRGRGEGERRQDDLVAGPHPGGEQREVQRGGGARGRDGVAAGAQRREVVLERRHPRALRQPAGAVHRGDRLDLLGGEAHVGQRHAPVDHRWAGG
jgi:hypothetical protein